MAFKVTNVYKEHFPALRFIGTRYTNDDRDASGGYGNKWDEWIKSDRFTAMTLAAEALPFTEDTIGLMTMRGDMTGFTYWVGMFFPAGTDTPDGFNYIDLPESDIGVGWICGKDGEIFGGPPHEAVCKRIEEDGIGKFRNDIAGEGSDTYCFYERYNIPRFTVKDADGNITLDYGNYIK